ncbi:hypothetical protein LRS05_01565 [Flavobacterium sp. J372]|uniref:hypothetical protein n=1 Tax=Flavobacterium sp. J372 TaxID=2898436 RepID=UPI00215111DB|nr:hypothetical protein [Flavobacterium sp. J372]MCR5860911.1 hypothetical protein [Flavobacterium sp. J372]
MTIKQLLSGMFLTGTVFTMSAQTNVANATTTSGGLGAGTNGYNTFYGANAGTNTTSNDNTFIGNGAGNYNTTGTQNTFVGILAGFDCDTGNKNVYVGFNTGEGNTVGSQNVLMGHEAGQSFTGSNCTFLGYRAGNASFGLNNVYVGDNAGENSSGSGNIFIGSNSGFSSSSGNSNLFLGVYAGLNNTGSSNLFFGNSSGQDNETGSQNTFIGINTGRVNATGANNVYLGYAAGSENIGSGNVFLGYYAGERENSASNKLYIENGQSNKQPLIWGDFAADLLKLNAKVGIGLGAAAFPTATGEINVSGYKLFVKGGILTEEVRVKLAAGWADYVFDNSYSLKPLEDVECFIAENGHLPNVPSAKQVAEEGIELGDMARIQQEKIEELTLYAIQQQKQLDKQDAEIKVLKAMVQELLEKKQ